MITFIKIFKAKSKPDQFSRFMAARKQIIILIQLVIIICSICIMRSGWAQQMEWLDQFGTSGYDGGTGIATHASDVYVTGRVQGALPGQIFGQYEDGFIRKYDETGSEIWTRQFSNSDFGTEPFAIAIDDTGVYVAGRAEISDKAGAFVRGYDHDGNDLWTYLFPIGDRATSMFEAWGIALHPTGIYVAGTSLPVNCPTDCNGNALVSRLDYAGSELWTAIAGTPFEHPFGFRRSAIGSGIAVDDSGIYVAGSLGSADVRSFDVNGSMIDEFGTGTLHGGIRENLVLDDTGIYVMGTPCPPQCQFKTAVRKYHRNGNVLWTHELPDEFEQGDDIAIDASGIYITGSVLRHFPSGPFNVYIRKFDTNGNRIWTHEFGAAEAGNVGYGVEVNAGNVYVTGFTSGTFVGESATPMQDIFVTKFNQNFPSRGFVLNDINSNSTVEIGVQKQQYSQDTVTTSINDAKTSASIQAFDFDNTLSYIDTEVMADINSNGAQEIVSIRVGSIKAQVNDSLTGDLINSIEFNSSGIPIDLAIIADQNGNSIPELVALVEGSASAEIRDAMSAELVNQIDFDFYNFTLNNVAIISDLNGNGSPELAVLGNSNQRGRSDKVEIRDSKTDARIKRIYYGGTYESRQLIVLPDQNGNGSAELAVLRTGAPSETFNISVVIKDSLTGDTLNNIRFSQKVTPLKIVVVPDLTNDTVPDIGLLSSNPKNTSVKVELRDSVNGNLIRYIGFNKRFVPSDIMVLHDLNQNGSAEVAVVGRRADGQGRTIIKDALTGIKINAVDF